MDIWSILRSDASVAIRQSSDLDVKTIVKA